MYSIYSFHLDNSVDDCYRECSLSADTKAEALVAAREMFQMTGILTTVHSARRQDFNPMDRGFETALVAEVIS